MHVVNGIAQRAYAERMMHFVDDPVLRYEMKPGVVCGEGVTNELGMIDSPRAVQKPPDTLRVACLGDSVGGRARGTVPCGSTGAGAIGGVSTELG